MKYKIKLFCLIILASFRTAAQDKTFSFSCIQTRDSIQQWGNLVQVDERAVNFTNDSININIDKVYHLNVLKIRTLPDNCFIYLCKDQNSNDVTITLVGDEKMFLYSDRNRFMISFNNPAKEKNPPQIITK